MAAQPPHPYFDNNHYIPHVPDHNPPIHALQHLIQQPVLHPQYQQQPDLHPQYQPPVQEQQYDDLVDDLYGPNAGIMSRRQMFRKFRKPSRKFRKSRRVKRY